MLAPAVALAAGCDGCAGGGAVDAIGCICRISGGAGCGCCGDGCGCCGDDTGWGAKEEAANAVGVGETLLWVPSALLGGRADIACSGRSRWETHCGTIIGRPLVGAASTAGIGIDERPLHAA